MSYFRNFVSIEVSQKSEFYTILKEKDKRMKIFNLPDDDVIFFNISNIDGEFSLFDMEFISQDVSLGVDIYKEILLEIKEIKEDFGLELASFNLNGDECLYKSEGRFQGNAYKKELHEKGKEKTLLLRLSEDFFVYKKREVEELMEEMKRFFPNTFYSINEALQSIEDAREILLKQKNINENTERIFELDRDERAIKEHFNLNVL